MRRFTIPRVAHCQDGCFFGPGQDLKLPVFFLKQAVYENIHLKRKNPVLLPGTFFNPEST